MPKMCMQFGMDKQSGEYCKRPFRWLFVIPKVCADDSPGANALPPEKSARPTLSFKEMDVNHLIEDVYYPAKPEWKPITITLYDLKRQEHPVFKWLQNMYDPENGIFYEPNSGENDTKFIKECTLKMLDGTGNVIETWIYEDCWPQAVNFQSLDMGMGSGILTCEITLRYARAYITTSPSISASSTAASTARFPL